MNELKEFRGIWLTWWMQRQGLDAVLVGINYEGDCACVNGRPVWGVARFHRGDGSTLTFLGFVKGDDVEPGGVLKDKMDKERFACECLTTLEVWEAYEGKMWRECK